MPRKAETIYIDLGFENLMSTLYGSSGHPCVAGHTPTRNWKKQLLQLFRTLRTAIAKNLNGDDPHKEHLMERCDTAIDAIKRAEFKDEIACDALQFAFEILFGLIGHLPNNWQKRRAHHSYVTSLARYRTFSYVGTARQKAQRVTHAAYYDRLGSADPNFETLINKLKRDCSDDPDRFLAWLRAEHRSLYDRFI
jgi:hypothetical protein